MHAGDALSLLYQKFGRPPLVVASYDNVPGDALAVKSDDVHRFPLPKYVIPFSNSASCFLYFESHFERGCFGRKQSFSAPPFPDNVARFQSLGGLVMLMNYAAHELCRS